MFVRLVKWTFGHDHFPSRFAGSARQALPMLDPFDHSKFSVRVPSFRNEKDELKWINSLTGQQRLELLRLINLARYGADLMSRPIERVLEIMTLEEFSMRKAVEDRIEAKWRRDHGWPPMRSRKGEGHGKSA
jgi:hypothetical protein